MSDTPIYDETNDSLLAHEIDSSFEEVQLLDRHPWVDCDRHPGTPAQAIIGYKGIVLCGHCAHVAGIASHQLLNTWLREENKKKGSSNLWTKDSGARLSRSSSLSFWAWPPSGRSSAGWFTFFCSTFRSSARRNK